MKVWRPASDVSRLVAGRIWEPMMIRDHADLTLRILCYTQLSTHSFNHVNPANPVNPVYRFLSAQASY